MAKIKKNRGRKPSSSLSASARLNRRTQKPLSSDLTHLADQYKTFKKAHPAKAARVPEDIKLKARELYRQGATYSAIASAAGITIAAVRNWIEPKSTERDALVYDEPRSRSFSGASAHDSWVKLRIRGNEVEMAESDFLKLLKSGLGQETVD